MVGLSVAASAVPPEDSHTPQPSGIVAQIHRHPRFHLERLREEYRIACKECIRLAFPAPSRHACSRGAAQMIGTDPDKIARILALETATPDPLVMAAAARYFYIKTKRISPVILLWQQIAGLA